MIVAGRTILLSKPEPLPWFSEVGEVLSDGGLAIITGWFFNWLVVERPRRRDRVRMYQAVGHNLKLLAQTAQDVAEGLAATSGTSVVNAKNPTLLEWEAMLDPLDTDTPTGSLVVPLPTGGTRNATVRELVEHYLGRADMWSTHLTVALPYFDTELVALLQRERQSSLRFVMRSLPSAPAYRLAGLGEPFEQYSQQCSALESYFESHVRAHMT